ncbi:hypothetical protein HK100_012047 [Physocladia obscura]|uniref:Uncharacterized protein n=1 Tax=Physocladia obscura TaxID=109957 RepID=A0AAD5T0F3_9FUNG|nr:hypothetical protein HK100_012047 [Physocladia obscura]
MQLFKAMAFISWFGFISSAFPTAGVGADRALQSRSCVSTNSATIQKSIAEASSNFTESKYHEECETDAYRKAVIKNSTWGAEPLPRPTMQAFVNKTENLNQIHHRVHKSESSSKSYTAAYKLPENEMIAVANATAYLRKQR